MLVLLAVPCICYERQRKSMTKFLSGKIDPALDRYKLKYLRDQKEIKQLEAMREEEVERKRKRDEEKKENLKRAGFVTVVFSAALFASRAFYDLVRVSVSMVVVVLSLYIAELLVLLCNAYLIMRGFYRNDVELLQEKVQDMADALKEAIPFDYLKYLPDWWSDIFKWISKFNWKVLAIQSVDVTCEGT